MQFKLSSILVLSSLLTALSCYADQRVGVTLSSGLAIPQFDTPRSRYIGGVGVDLISDSNFAIGLGLGSAEKTTSNEFYSGHAREVFVGARFNYWMNPDQLGLRFGASVGWVHETAELSDGASSQFNSTTNDLYFGPTVGYDWRIWNTVRVGPEMNLVAITQNSVALYPSALLVIRNQF